MPPFGPPRSAPTWAPTDDAPPTPRMAGAGELAPAEVHAAFYARVKAAARRELEQERLAAARLEVATAEANILRPGATAAELAGPLALKALRVLERRLDDPSERIQVDAARVTAQCAPRVAEMLVPTLAAPDDPEARRAALLAALASPEFVALLLEVVAASEAPARLALEAAGWVAP